MKYVRHVVATECWAVCTGVAFQLRYRLLSFHNDYSTFERKH